MSRLHGVLRLRGSLLVAVSACFQAAGLGDEQPIVGKHAMGDILNEWRASQGRVDNVAYRLEGETLIPARALRLPESNERHPAEDRLSPFSVELVLDFKGSRARRVARGSIFNLTTKDFVPDRFMELYDGALYRTVQLLDEMRDAGAEIDEWTPELYLAGPTLGHRFFRRLEWPLLFHHGIVPSDGSVRLTPVLDPAFFSIDGWIEHEGRPCAIVACSSPTLDRNSRLQLTVDPTRGCGIVRASISFGGVESFRVDIEHAERAGAWSPKRWTETSFFLDQAHEVDRIDNVELVDVAVNRSLDDELFAVTPTPGMVVSDRASGEEYVQPDVGGKRQTVRQAMLEKEIAGSPRRWVGFAVIALMMFLASMALWLRRRRRGK